MQAAQVVPGKSTFPNAPVDRLTRADYGLGFIAKFRILLRLRDRSSKVGNLAARVKCTVDDVRAHSPYEDYSNINGNAA